MSPWITTIGTGSEVCVVEIGGHKTNKWCAGASLEAGCAKKYPHFQKNLGLLIDKSHRIALNQPASNSFSTKCHRHKVKLFFDN